MPRGGSRVGAGRKPKSLALHALHGTFRPGRHAARLATAAALPRINHTNSNSWRPTDEEWSALDETGRVFVAGYLDDYDIAPAEGRLLLELGHVASRLAEVRTARVDPLSSTKERCTLDRLEQGWLRLFTSLAAQLRAETP